MEGDDLHCSDEGIRLNLTSNTAQEFVFSAMEVRLITVGLPVIFTVGLLCNGAFIFVIARLPTMRTVTNVYLVNLAVSDILFLLALVIDNLNRYLNYQVRTPHGGVPGCILYNLHVYTMHFAGLALVTVTSLERYIAVCHPLRRRAVGGRGRTIKLVVACWLSALLLGGLMLPGFAKYQEYCLQWPEDDDEHHYRGFPNVVYICTPLGLWAYQMLYLAQMIPFTSVFLLNVFFYTRIVLRLNRRNVNNRRRSVTQTRNKVAIMLVTNGTIFLLTLSCFEIVSLLLFFEWTFDLILIPVHVRPPVLAAGKILVYINAAVNPVVYTVFNSQYRNAFVHAFKPSQCPFKWLRSPSLIGNLFKRPDEPISLSDVAVIRPAISSVSAKVYSVSYRNASGENDLQ